jgi:toluene monooxygenase electron transfer component
VEIIVGARNGARVFGCRPGEILLHAGLRQGIGLPYECASDTCGSCRARLVQGRAESVWPDAPGRRVFKDPRDLLTCQSVALGDCALQVSALRETKEPAPQPVPRDGILRSVRRLTHDVVTMDIDLDRPLDFDAGQFALIRFPGLLGARAYSMASFEPSAHRLSFIVKRKPGGGVSDWLFGDGVEGARLGLFAPLGVATFHPGVCKNLLCIAGGSGVAGIASILRRADLDGHFAAWDGHVFLGFRSARDAFYLDELQAARDRHPERLAVTVALSEEAVPVALAAAYPRLSFAHGLVHAVAGARMVGRCSDVRAYVAGPAPMVDASVRLLLREARLGPADIRCDKFN